MTHSFNAQLALSMLVSESAAIQIAKEATMTRTFATMDLSTSRPRHKKRETARLNARQRFRALFVEALERRTLLTAWWQNAANHYDIDANGSRTERTFTFWIWSSAPMASGR